MLGNGLKSLIDGRTVEINELVFDLVIEVLGRLHVDHQGSQHPGYLQSVDG